jgi:HPt (histidine-containing phosphotransfer) domain-containing protein
MDELLARLGGKIDVVPRLLAMFLNNSANYLELLRQAVVCNDVEQVRINAHTIKGAAANISAPKIKKTASTLEKLIQEGRHDCLSDFLVQLESEFKEFKEITEQLY